MAGRVYGCDARLSAVGHERIDTGLTCRKQVVAANDLVSLASRFPRRWTKGFTQRKFADQLTNSPRR